jgi:hypothetical protein
MKLEQAGRARFAGVLWGGISVMLVARAWPYFAGMTPGKQAMLVAASLLVGGAKGWFVLRKSSRRLIKRIDSMPGPQWAWSVWPLMFLPLIAVMIGGGLAMRHYLGDTYPSAVVLVYFGVGAALLTSSVPFFQAAGRFAAGLPALPEAEAQPAEQPAEA